MSSAQLRSGLQYSRQSGDSFCRKNARAHPVRRARLQQSRAHAFVLFFFMVLKPLRANRQIFDRVSSALWRRLGRCDPFPPPRRCSRRAYDLHDNVLRIRSGMEYLPHTERVEKSTCRYLNTYITRRVDSNRIREIPDAKHSKSLINRDTWSEDLWSFMTFLLSFLLPPSLKCIFNTDISISIKYNLVIKLEIFVQISPPFLSQFSNYTPFSLFEKESRSM